MKTCSCCHQEKDESEFQVRKASKDGLTASCKQCLRERDSARYVNERERRSAAHRKYMETPEGKAAHEAAVERWRNRNMVRRAAHIILGNAVRDGKVSRLPCLECGAEKTEGHHPDYDRPIDVIWLCALHHKQTHALFKRLIQA